MNPDSALSAGQLAIMAVVVTACLAVWLIIVFLAARQPRGTSADASARPREEGAAAPLARLPAGTGAPGKAGTADAAKAGTAHAGKAGTGHAGKTAA